MPRHPDFLIIGAMKAGTTSLANALGQHPDVFITEQKEIHFFDSPGFPEGFEDYLDHFSSPKLRAGSAPQGYTKTHLPELADVPMRIKALLPGVKLIYLVRDPIKRMESHFQEHFSQDQIGRGLHQLDPRLNSSFWNHLKGTSSYGFQLNQFLEHFHQDNILVLRLEDVIKQGDLEFKKLLNFLEVPNVPLQLSRDNSSENKYFLNAPIQRAFRHHSPLFKRLRSAAFFLGKRGGLMKRIFIKPAHKPELSSELRNSLKEHFKEDALSLKNPSLQKTIGYYLD